MRRTGKHGEQTNGQWRLRQLLWLACFMGFLVQGAVAVESSVLKPGSFAHHIERFNGMEPENVTNAVSNADSWAWLQQEIPFFECPDPEVEEMYYFRWWSFRKHLVQTPQGYVVTEFLTPVRHADAFNAISCAAGFHLAEGRWLHDSKYMDEDTVFWLRGNHGQPQKKFHAFSSWFATAVYERSLVNGNTAFLTNLLPDLVADYRAWETERQLTNGLFWQFDVRDGMEESISGSRKDQNARPTINAYMFANARSIAEIARLAKNPAVAKEFAGKSAQLQKRTQETLWNSDAQFFEVRRPDGSFSNVREEIGFIPWMFGLPDPGKKYSAAWGFLTDPQGFAAPAGVTTAERRHPLFRSHGVGTCEWDGAVWPFGTCQTLYGLAEVLRAGRQNRVTSQDYFDVFMAYVHSQHAQGKPYIGEYLDEVTGDWVNGKGGRSRYYNHSTFADLLITGVVGLRPSAGEVVEVNPLLPPGTWDWFCLEGVAYHGHSLTILWDKDGTRYGRGAGLVIIADGKEIARSRQFKSISGRLPQYGS